MSSDIQVHKYRLTLRAKLHYLPAILFIGGASALILGFTIPLIVSTLSDERTRHMGTVLLVVMGPLLPVFGVFFLFSIYIAVSAFFFAHLRVSSDGLERRIGSAYVLRAKWDDVERISAGVIYLKRAERSGLGSLFGKAMPSLERTLQLLPSAKNPVIRLADIRDWPDGDLKAVLWRYVPRAIGAESEAKPLESLRLWTSAHEYRWTLWAILRCFGRALGHLIILLFLVPFIIVLSPAIVQGSRVLSVGMIVALIVLAFLLVAQLVHKLAVAVGRLLSSYVRVSPEGVEYTVGSNFGFRASWPDVKQIAKERPRRLVATSKVALVENAEWFGPQMLIGLRPLIGLYRFDDSGWYSVFPLTGVRGWPKGNFADDLRRYAPHLFKP